MTMNEERIPTESNRGTVLRGGATSRVSGQSLVVLVPGEQSGGSAQLNSNHSVEIKLIWATLQLLAPVARLAFGQAM